MSAPTFFITKWFIKGMMIHSRQYMADFFAIKEKLRVLELKRGLLEEWAKKNGQGSFRFASRTLAAVLVAIEI